jgi:hypothetical protein
MEEIIIRLIKLPYKTHGVTVVDEEGDYNVYINDQLSYEQQLQATEHELKHIYKNHFYVSNSVEQVEKEV